MKLKNFRAPNKLSELCESINQKKRDLVPLFNIALLAATLIESRIKTSPFKMSPFASLYTNDEVCLSTDVNKISDPSVEITGAKNRAVLSRGVGVGGRLSAPKQGDLRAAKRRNLALGQRCDGFYI